jgi:hypothetical protein
VRVELEVRTSGTEQRIRLANRHRNGGCHIQTDHEHEFDTAR